MFQSFKSEPEESHALLILSDNESDHSNSDSRTHQRVTTRSTPHRDINSRVRQFFTTIDLSCFFCNICERQFKGTVANMKAHLNAIHKEIYDDIWAGNPINVAIPPLRSFPTSNIKPEAQSPDNKYVRNDQMNFHNFRSEVPTSSGMRTRRFDGDDQSSQEQQPKRSKKDENAQNLVEFILSGGNLSNFSAITGKVYSRQILEKIFKDTARKIKAKIKQEMRGKIPFCTAFDSNGLYSVTAHFIEDMELKVRQLGCVKSAEIDTSFGVEKCLETFEVFSHSASILFTNGTVEDKNLTLIKAQQNLNAMTKIFLDCEPQLIDDVGQLKLMQDKSRESFVTSAYGNPGLDFCGSKLLRSVARKVNKKFEKQCENVRKISENLGKNRKIKIVDENRWDFSLILIEGLKNFETELEVDQDTKSFMAEYFQVFSIVRQAIKQVDNKKILFGDFFLAWTLCEIKLGLRKDEKFGIAKAFVEEMKSDGNELNGSDLKCGTFHANFLLDPRFKYSADDAFYDLKAQHEAIEHCLSTNEALIEGKSIKAEESESFTTSTTDDDLPIEYRMLLERTGGGNSLPSSNYKNSEFLRQKLKKFGLEPKKIVKPGEKFDVLEYWKQAENHPDYKDLLQIASVILANPASRINLLNDFAAFSLAAAQIEGEISIDSFNDFLLVSGNLEMIEEI